MVALVVTAFSWDSHAEIVRAFHEDIIVSNIRPEHLCLEEYLRLLRASEKDGLPAYMRGLREACEEGVDGMFIWETEGRVVEWSWLKVHENEFFREGAYGEVNEIYVGPDWRRKGLGKTIMAHAQKWFRERGVNTVRVEVLASNEAARSFYKRLGFEPNYMTLQKTLSEEA